MNEPEVFTLADRTLASVVARIADNQWDVETPASFAMRQLDHQPTLREMVNYHAYDDAWVPDMLARRRMEEPGKGPSAARSGGPSGCSPLR